MLLFCIVFSCFSWLQHKYIFSRTMSYFMCFGKLNKWHHSLSSDAIGFPLLTVLDLPNCFFLVSFISITKEYYIIWVHLFISELTQHSWRLFPTYLFFSVSLLTEFYYYKPSCFDPFHILLAGCMCRRFLTCILRNITVELYCFFFFPLSGHFKT